eukprot:14694230-Alexandrium_andersonii.AAC.1
MDLAKVQTALSRSGRAIRAAYNTFMSTRAAGLKRVLGLDSFSAVLLACSSRRTSAKLPEQQIPLHT